MARLFVSMLLVALLPFAVLCAGTISVSASATGGEGAYTSGLAAAKLGHYATAIGDFEQAIVHGHNDPGTYYQLGLAFQGNKQLDYAAWAIAKALTDPVFNAVNTEASKALDTVQNAGGADSGPPPLLKNASMTPMRAPAETPSSIVLQEANAALAALKPPDQAFFASPEYQKVLTIDNQGLLTDEAANAQNDSNTTVKYAFLGGVPAPFISLTAYADSLRRNLNLSRAVVVVVTPKSVAASSDRLDEATAARISAEQLQSLGEANPAALAAAVARAEIKQADSNDASSTTRSVIMAAIAGAALVAVIAVAVRRIARSGSRAAAKKPTPVRLASTKTRPR